VTKEGPDAIIGYQT